MARQADTTGHDASSWKDRYGERHRLVRITAFPAGVRAPEKVRVYSRHDHHVLQWWDPAAGKTLSERMEGDLIDALARARAIDDRLAQQKTAGRGRRKLGHEELVHSFLKDLQRRADAGELAAATVVRYRSALDHYVSYVSQPAMHAVCPWAERVDRNFALGFAGYLNQLQITPNGRANARPRPMLGQSFVLDAVRAMYEWAADPERGNLLGDGFRNPFRRSVVKRQRVVRDMIEPPDVTLAMAQQMLEHCDEYQLRLFAPLLFGGLRASEPVYLLYERVDADWIRIGSIEGLDYVTKGRRDKRVPLLEALRQLLVPSANAVHGLVFQRRSVVEGRERAPLAGASLGQLVEAYQQRCQRAGRTDAVTRERMREHMIHDAGGLSYKIIQGEFHRLARALNWPTTATVKDLRHLFATAMHDGGMTEREIQYLMGHSQGRHAIVHYTHLAKLAEHYRRAVEREMGPLVAVVERRLAC